VGIVDGLADYDRSLAERVQLLDELFSQRLDIDRSRSVLSHTGLEEYVEFAVLDESTPPAGIYGVGATIPDPSPRERRPTPENPFSWPQPALFVMPQMLDRWPSDEEIITAPIYETRLADFAHKLTGLEVDDLWVVSLPIPYEQSATAVAGEDLVCHGIKGTCGVEVRTANGSAAVLTAGHVARPVGSSIFASGSKIGSVLFTDSLSQHSPPVLAADVAVVELGRGVVATNRRRVPGQVQAKQLDNVVADHQGGPPQSGWIRNAVTSFALRQNVGLWGEVFVTDRAISIGGNSGAPVYLNDGSDRLLGHVVAGAPPAYTLIQDIGYILNYANVKLA
jgi:hypothetical protein